MIDPLTNSSYSKAPFEKGSEDETLARPTLFTYVNTSTRHRVLASHSIIHPRIRHSPVRTPRESISQARLFRLNVVLSLE